jgi:hypothetical protein
MISTVTVVLDSNKEISPKDLVDISKKYPFVEWGIHLYSPLSKNSFCHNKEWLNQLVIYADKLRLQGILHDELKDDILQGNISLKYKFPEIWPFLRRIQIDVRNGTENILESIQLLTEKKIVLLTIDDDILKIKNTSILYPKDLFYKNPSSTRSTGYYIYSEDVLLAIEKARISPNNFWLYLDLNGNFDIFQIEQCLDQLEDYVTQESWVQGLLRTKAIQTMVLTNQL